MTPTDLREILPTLDGWTRSDVRTQTLPEPEAATVASATYVKEGGRLELEVSDTGGSAAMVDSLAGMAGTDINRELGNGYFRGVTVADSPAVESWNTDEHIGELTVLVKKRFIIHVGGRGLADATPMRTLVERMPLGQLR